jgi:hypothetical protein
MKIELKKGEAFLAASAALRKPPSITTATRLETQPTAVNLKLGLQAPVADPLWMLARQWQFNEFQGEDAGTPLTASFALSGAPVSAFRAGKEGQPWQSVEVGQPPIETRVEAEPIWATHARLRGEVGLHLLRMAPNQIIRAALLQAYALELPAPPDPEADRAGLLWSIVLHRRTIDAKKVADDLTPLRGPDGKLSGLPAGLVVPAAQAATVKTLLEEWLGWLAGLLHEGPENNPAWQRDRMEYAFALATGPLARDGSAVTLAAEEYTDGHVDWEEFQAQAAPPQNDRPAFAARQFAVKRRHPTPARYPGMPADRYWEFEDGNVSFAGAEAGVTDLLRMTVTEFALTFGNDWFLLPVRLPVGALYTVDHFEVVDSFGVKAVVKPVRNVNQTPWRIFELTAAPVLGEALKHTMLLPDSLDGVMEGAILEHTLLARDEMANLAWAIEKKVQGVSGEPLDRDLEAQGLAFQQQIKFEEPPSPQLVYRLATPVPANWTPLLPVRRGLDLNNPLDIQLDRAGMKRFYPEPATLSAPDSGYENFLAGLDAQDSFVRRLPIAAEANIRIYVFYPRGWLLRRNPTEPMPDDDVLRLEEEEVPRIGASLKRKFQYARTSDGRSWLWIGRSKIAGRGEAASNLRFDVAVKTTTIR